MQPRTIELISSLLYKLNFSFNSHYGGYFDMEVSMDDTVLTTASGEIGMCRNGLEE